MNTDEITMFRDARPDVPAYSVQARQKVLAALLTAGTEPAPRHSVGRRRIVAVAGLTAVLAAGVTVVQNVDFGGGHAGKPEMLGPVASAEELVSRATDQAASGPAQHPRPDQWAYTKVILAGSSQGWGGFLKGQPDRRYTIEEWTGVDGTRTARVVNGKVSVDRLNAKERGEGGRPNYHYVLSLPTDPKAMLAAISKQDNPDGNVFIAIETLLDNYVLPPKLRAAMYGALTKIPGVRFDRDVTDMTGRHGVGLYQIEEGYLQDEIVINPTTYQYMGERTIAIRDHVGKGTDGSFSVRKGQTLGWLAQLANAIVDEPGER